MEDHGVAYRTRRAVAREHVLAMQALWRDEEASFRGEHVDIPPIVVLAQARAARPGADRRRGRAEDVRPHRRVRATAGSRSAAPA